MATFQCVLHLIVLNGFVLPGLSLSSSSSSSSSSSVAAFKTHPAATQQRLHLTDQKQSEFPRKLMDSEASSIDGLGRYDEKAELEMDGEMEEGYPGDGYSDPNREEMSPVEQMDDERRRLVEGSKGQRWAKGKLGGSESTVRGRTTGLLEKDKNDGEDEKEKRKWGENSMRVWGKRAGSGTDSRNWSEKSGWDKGVPIATDKRKWGDNSMSVWGKRSEDGGEKRKWGDNSMSVWGKRSGSGDGRTSSHAASSDGKINEAAVNGEVTWMPDWIKQEKVVDPAKDTGSSHRVLHKRSILDHEQNHLMARPPPRYEWLAQELSKRNRPRWATTSSNGKQQSYGGPKRNWETNTMKVWGKRGLVWDAVPTWDDDDDDHVENVDSLEDVAGKRTWTSDNAIRVWGKRNRNQPDDGSEIIVLPMYDH